MTRLAGWARLDAMAQAATEQWTCAYYARAGRRRATMREHESAGAPPARAPPPRAWRDPRPRPCGLDSPLDACGSVFGSYLAFLSLAGVSRARLVSGSGGRGRARHVAVQVSGYARRQRQEALEQLERQREDDRRVLLGGDLGQRLQVAELQ